jgi:general secretion pathway protein K
MNFRAVIAARSRRSGIALIMVLLVIVMLGILAGGFAYSMKVETTLARRASFDPEMEWLGRSGVELACYVLGQGSVGIAASYDALNQKWAGGTGDTNSVVSEIPLDNYPLGNGVLSIKIIDLDRKFNINVADEVILRQALILVGVDAAATPAIVDSILDWRDPDSARHPMGAEADDYSSTPNFGYPPYFAKDGPIDDLTELLLVRGVTPAMFWGTSGGSYSTSLPRVLPASQSKFDEPVYVVGLVDLFTPLSGRLLNINTASATALQVLPTIDENVAQAIIQARAGPDGVEGNEDDMPFRSPQEVAYRVPGFDPAAAAQLSRYFTVRSLVFEVKVTVRIGENHREFVALVRRNNPRDVQVMSFYWR